VWDGWGGVGWSRAEWDALASSARKARDQDLKQLFVRLATRECFGISGEACGRCKLRNTTHSG